jgi:transglutaminase/protease-like cytokinesis protein 3
MKREERKIKILFLLVIVPWALYAQTKAPVSVEVPAANGETAYTYHLNTADIVMKRVPAAILSQRKSDPVKFVRSMAEYINEKSTDDYDKVKKVHDWIALNTRYDMQSYLSGRYPSQSYEAVLKNGLAVCSGYAELFKTFCDALQVDCKIVEGYARGRGRKLFKDENVYDTNHDWNIVTIEGKEYLIDCTWDSGPYETAYLFANPKEFIYSHFPLNSSDQLLDPPVTAEAFTNLPYLDPLFFQTASQYPEYNKITEITEITAGEELFFEVILKPGFELGYWWLNETGGKKGKDVYMARKDIYRINLSELKPGKYILRLLVRKPGDKMYWSCADYGFVVTNNKENNGNR